MSVDLFRRADPGATEAALVDKLNAGPFLVNYLGHGSVEVWDGLLDDTAAAGLSNGHPSIYVVMNCLNGFFHDLYTTSLAETLLEAPGGAVAVWASSTLADFDQQPMFNQEFLMGIGLKSLGEAAVAAKGAITDLDARRTWLLFGDPTLLGSPASPAALDAGAADATPHAGRTRTRHRRPTPAGPTPARPRRTAGCRPRAARTPGGRLAVAVGRPADRPKPMPGPTPPTLRRAEADVTARWATAGPVRPARPR